MTGLDYVNITRAKVLFCPIVVDNMHRARLDDAYMPDLAAIRAGQAYVIEPGHDAWVVGDEAVVGFEFDSRTVEEYAKG